MDQTHFGTQAGRWLDCCGGTSEAMWCNAYTGGFSDEDEPSWVQQQSALKRADRLAQERIQAGMPEVIARGVTKDERMLLSHTLHDCHGIGACGMGENKNCAGAYAMTDLGASIWTCCKKQRQLYWCARYHGIQM